MSEVVENQISDQLPSFFLLSWPFCSLLVPFPNLSDPQFCRFYLAVSHFLKGPPLAQVSTVESEWKTNKNSWLMRTGSMCTWRRVSALANSATVCVIRWRDNSSHLTNSPNLISNHLPSSSIHLTVWVTNTSDKTFGKQSTEKHSLCLPCSCFRIFRDGQDLVQSTSENK